MRNIYNFTSTATRGYFQNFIVPEEHKPQLYIVGKSKRVRDGRFCCIFVKLRSRVSLLISHLKGHKGERF